MRNWLRSCLRCGHSPDSMCGDAGRSQLYEAQGARHASCCPCPLNGSRRGAPSAALKKVLADMRAGRLMPCTQFLDFCAIYNARNEIVHHGHLPADQDRPSTWFITAQLLGQVLAWFAAHQDFRSQRIRRRNRRTAAAARINRIHRVGLVCARPACHARVVCRPTAARVGSANPAPAWSALAGTKLRRWRQRLLQSPTGALVHRIERLLERRIVIAHGPLAIRARPGCARRC